MPIIRDGLPLKLPDPVLRLASRMERFLDSAEAGMVWELAFRIGLLTAAFLGILFLYLIWRDRR